MYILSRAITLMTGVLFVYIGFVSVLHAQRDGIFKSIAGIVGGCIEILGGLWMISRARHQNSPDFTLALLVAHAIANPYSSTALHYNIPKMISTFGQPRN